MKTSRLYEQIENHLIRAPKVGIDFIIDGDHLLDAAHAELKNLTEEVGKFLDYTTKLEDRLELLTECGAVEDTVEEGLLCYCQGCKNKALLDKERDK